MFTFKNVLNVLVLKPIRLRIQNGVDFFCTSIRSEMVEFLLLVCKCGFLRICGIFLHFYHLFMSTQFIQIATSWIAKNKLLNAISLLIIVQKQSAPFWIRNRKDFKTQMSPNGPYGPNGPKWSQMSQNGPKQTQIVKHQPTYLLS